MRRIDLTFSALRVPLDFVALTGAAIMAYSLRLSRVFTDVKPLLQQIPLTDYLATTGVFVVIWILLFAIAGLYAIQPKRIWDELSSIILACTAGIMVVIAAVFFGRTAPATSRFVILAVWLLSIVFVWITRLALRFVRRQLLRNKVGHQQVAIVGQDKVATQLIRFYEANPITGYSVIKHIKTWNEAAAKQLKDLHDKGKLHGIVLCDPALNKEQALELITFAESNHLTFRYLADLFAARFANVEVSTVAGIPIIEVKRTPLDGWGRIIKRLFDIVGSSILLFFLSPIMILTAIAVVIDTRGGVFFSHLPNGEPVTRIGEGGHPFHYFKFRSMKKDEHFKRYGELAHLNIRTDGPLVKTKNDPRITRVGAFIRKWSIDELPELILVLLGRMSLVGPRPHYPEEVENYKLHHRRVLAIKPGITGMAQISGRSDLNFEDEVRLDTWYIENWSLWQDLSILFRTPFAVVSHRGVEEGV